MAASGAAVPDGLGFLTVVEDPEHGLFGGYLVLNMLGRPLEFHCTTPVKPNRAQQILYGPTLEPYLYGELIGQALLAKAAVRPRVVCTDRPAVLAAYTYSQAPLVLVNSDDDEGEQPSGSAFRCLDAPHAAGRVHTFTVGRHRLAVQRIRSEDARRAERELAQLDEDFDLNEPFDRIREAIEEAQRGGR